MRVRIKKLAVAGLQMALGAMVIIATGFAADGTVPLIAHAEPIAMPSVGRILFGFIVTVGVAIGVIYGLRRWLPHLANRLGSTNTLRLTGQSAVQNGMKFHVVTIDQQTILVAEGKSGVAMIELHGASSAQAPSAKS